MLTLKKNVPVRLAVHYFFFFPTIAVYVPYFSLYLSARGLHDREIGFVMAMIPLVGLLAQPLWGMIVDRYHNERWLVSIGIGMSIVVFLWLAHLSGLVWYIVAIAAFALFQTGVIPVVDSLTVRITGIGNYGKIRLFGSLGWTLSAVVVSYVYHKFSVLMLPYAYMVAGILAIVGWTVYPRIRDQDTRVYASISNKSWHGMGRLLRNKRFILVLVVTSMVTMSQLMNGNYFTLYYHDLGHPMNQLGWIYASGAILELPFMFVVGKLLYRYGPGRVFMVGATVFAMRWVTLSLSPPTIVLLIAQMTHGISIGFTIPAGVAIVTGMSDESSRATAQALYSAFNTGVAAIVGNIIGGLTLTYYGPAAIYRVAAGFAIVGVLSMGILLRSWGEFIELNTG